MVVRSMAKRKKQGLLAKKKVIGEYGVLVPAPLLYGKKDTRDGDGRVARSKVSAEYPDSVSGNYLVGEIRGGTSFKQETTTWRNGRKNIIILASFGMS